MTDQDKERIENGISKEQREALRLQGQIDLYVRLQSHASRIKVTNLGKWVDLHDYIMEVRAALDLLNNMTMQGKDDCLPVKNSSRSNSYCQKDIEQKNACSIQCDHCREYYKSISNAFDKVVSYQPSIQLISKDYFNAGVEFGKIEGFNEGAKSRQKEIDGFKIKMADVMLEHEQAVNNSSYNEAIHAVLKLLLNKGYMESTGLVRINWDEIKSLEK